jgi:hypothetical protein
MLRACILPRATYAIRTAAPQLIHDFAVEFDREVQNTVAAIIQRRPKPEGHVFGPSGESYRLPIGMGGVGLRAACSVSAMAYVGSLAIAIGFMDQQQREALGSGGMVHDGLTCALKRLADIGISEVLYVPNDRSESKKKHEKPRACYSVAAFIEHYSEVSAVGLEVQRQLTARFESNIKKGLWCDQKVKARMRSAGDKNAIKWLTTPPSEFQLRLSDLEVVRALRHRMGIAPVDGNVNCVCGTVITDHCFDHFHSCNHVTGPACDARHMQLQKALARVTAESGVQCKMDYVSSSAKESDSHPGSNQRPDCIFFALHSTGADIVTDISIVNPSSASYISLPKPLSAAARAESLKRKSYTKYVQYHRSTFCAFVAESYGAFGTSMLEILQRLSAKVEENQVLASTVVYRLFNFNAWACAVLSTAIQRGNSHLVDAAMRLCARKAKRRI